MHKKNASKHTMLGKKIFFFLGIIAIFGGLFWYVNSYIYNFRAALPPIGLTFSSTPATVDITGSTLPEFNVSFTLTGQKISAAEFIITYDGSLVEYAKEYNQTSGFSEVKDSTATNYFNSPPLIETVTTVSGTQKQLRLVLLSEYTNPANAAWTTNVLGNLKFRAKAPGAAAITVVKAGTPKSEFAGVSSTGDVTYFDLPTSDIKATVNITQNGASLPTATPGGATATPTTDPVCIVPTDMYTPTPTQEPQQQEGKITKLRLKSPEDSMVSVKWNKYKGKDYYKVYASKNATKNFKQLKKTTRQKAIFEMKSCTTYYFKVVAFDNDDKKIATSDTESIEVSVGEPVHKCK